MSSSFVNQPLCVRRVKFSISFSISIIFDRGNDRKSLFKTEKRSIRLFFFYFFFLEKKYYVWGENIEEILNVVKILNKVTLYIE